MGPAASGKLGSELPFRIIVKQMAKTQALNGRYMPTVADVAFGTNVITAQKADFAKLPFQVSRAEPDRPRWSEDLHGSAAV